MGSDIKAELQRAYAPAWELASTLGCIRSCFGHAEAFGMRPPAEMVLNAYRHLVERIDAATKVATDTVLRELDKANAQPVIIGTGYHVSAFGLVLHEAYSEARGAVAAIDLEVGEQLPPIWGQSVTWPDFTESEIGESIDAMGRVIGRKLGDEPVQGPLAAFYIYKEFSRAIDYDVRLPLPNIKADPLAKRNQWFYEQRLKGLSLRDIVNEQKGAEFKRLFVGQAVGSPTRVGDAVKLHCKANGLPTP